MAGYVLCELAGETGMSISVGMPTRPAASSTIHRISKPKILRLGLTIVILSIFFGIASFSIRLGITSLDSNGTIANILLGINGVLVLAMGVLIAWHIYVLRQARLSGQAGARLHVRLVTLFSLMALLPTITVAVFASVTLKRGMDTYFSQGTRQIVENALIVAEAYVQEHGQIMGADVTAMAGDLDRAYKALTEKRFKFSQVFRQQAVLRGLPASFIVSKDKKVIASVLASSDTKYIQPSDQDFENARNGKLVVIPPRDTNLVRALVQLKKYDGAFLYAYRFIDPKIIQHLKNARAGEVKYDNLEAQRNSQIYLFALMYTGLALIFLLSSFWFGLWVADRLVAPIGRLISASLDVARGDLDVVVPVHKSEGDLAAFSQSFNQMTTQLRSQRMDLVDANKKLEERRRFTEAVLSDVSAGVLSVDTNGIISLANESAETMVGSKSVSLVGQPINKVLPEFSDVIKTALSNKLGQSEQQLNLVRANVEHNLLIKVSTEKRRRKARGYVITFDDITELVSAQRTSAWADIARRIAHEIKNPLTPIQLSAERLRRKYRNEIKTDPEVFEKCTETIIRQVGDIGSMVDEFSSFARMPSAVLKPVDFGKTIQDAVFLQKVGHKDVEINLTLPKSPVIAMIDRRLMTQALTNLVKNALESIDSRRQKSNEEDYHGVIDVQLKSSSRFIRLKVIDNGIGLPQEKRSRLFEPYMTTREKGTGLGLAIVKKIVEEHSGTIHLGDAPDKDKEEKGAMVTIELPPQLTAAEEPVSGKKNKSKNQKSGSSAKGATSKVVLKSKV